MRKIRKSLIPLLVLLLIFSLGLCVTACDNKGGDRITLTFVTNGGSKVSSMKVDKLSEVTLPEATRNGFDFIGWHVSEDLSDTPLMGKITAPEVDTTYYAEWAEANTTHKVTLDLDGGTLDGVPTVFRMKTGENIYNRMRNLTPAKGDLQFGAWFYNNKQLSSIHTMPEEDITLVAKYKVGYTIQTYRINVSGTKYDQDEQTTTNYDYVGETVTPVHPEIAHFVYTETPTVEGYTSVDTLKLGEKASENVFKFFYNRERCPINFSSNLPDNVNVRGVMDKAETVYGGLYVLPENRFTAEGYRFVGWSLNGANEPLDEEVIRIEGATTLYAVWDKGFIDKYSSRDYVFFPRDNDKIAILSRGGYEFEGVRNGDEFSFTLPTDDTLNGKVYNNYYFALERENLAGTYYAYNFDYNPDHNITDRVNENVTLVVDAFLDAEYTDEQGNKHQGTLIYNREMGDYRFTGKDEELTFDLQFARYDDKLVFSVCSHKEQNAYIECILVGDVPYVLGQYNIVLDGYGAAYLYTDFGGLLPVVFAGTYYITNEITEGAISMLKAVVSIEDTIGLLTPDEEPGTLTQILYTLPIGTSSDGLVYGYVSADIYEGGYTGDGEMGLILDGLGIFSDSAIYTDADGVEHRGRYTVNRSYLNGIIVTLQPEGEDVSEEIKLSIDLGVRRTVEVYEESVTTKRTEYLLMTGAFDFPLMVMYDEEKENVDGVEYAKAELYMSDDGGETLVLAAEGYITEEDVGMAMNYEGNIERFYIYTFKVTECIDQARPGVVPKESMRFYKTAANSVEDMSVHLGYVLLEIDGSLRYTEYLLDNGGKIWGNTNVTIEGLGSLYFEDTDISGMIYEGSFGKSRDEDFQLDLISFLYQDGYSVRTDVYEVEGNNATKHSGQKMNLYTIALNENTNQQFYANNIIIDGNLLDAVDSNGNAVKRGKARYCDLQLYIDEYIAGTQNYPWVDAVYEEHQRGTMFQHDYYTLYVADEKICDFAIFVTQDAYGSILPLYFVFNSEAIGTYSGNDGSSLSLDGYYWAEYTDASGNTYEGPYDISGNMVYITLENGYDTYLRLGDDGHTFVTLDYSYGSYYLIDINYVDFNTGSGEYYQSIINFDGQGGVSVTWPNGSKQTGTYELIDEELREYRVNANFGQGKTMPQGGWRVRLMEANGASGCIVYDGSTEGRFYNDKWDVMYIDGFGSGSLYSSDGTLAGTGLYTVVNAERGFMVFTFEETAKDAFIIFDAEKGTFEIQDYSQINYLYVAEDLDYIALTDTAEVRLGSIWSGQYFFDDENIYAYVTDYQTAYRLVEIPRPTGATYDYNGKTYYKVENKNFDLDGQVKFFDKSPDTVIQTLDISISFQMQTGGNFNTPAVVTIEDEEYNFVLNIYTNSVCNPRITYNKVDYDIDFHYTGDLSTSSFVVNAGYREIVMNNYNDTLRRNEQEYPLGGKIIKKVIGFGPYTVQAASYDGEFGYLNTHGRNVSKDTLKFSDFPESDVKIIGFNPSLGRLYEIMFTDPNFGDTKYVIDFFEYSSEDQGTIYVLWGFYTYEEFNYDEYKAYVKYLVYSNFGNTPGQADIERESLEGKRGNEITSFGKPYGVTLYKGEQLIYHYDTNVTLNYDGVWISENRSVDRLDPTGNGYLVKFTFDESNSKKVTAITVNCYKVKQLVSSGYLINLLVDEADGSIVEIVSVAYSYEGNYIYIANIKDLVKNEDNSWSFVGTPPSGTETNYTFAFTVTKGENENHETVYTYEVDITAE